jgi:hypothetical protein
VKLRLQSIQHAFDRTDIIPYQNMTPKRFLVTLLVAQAAASWSTASFWNGEEEKNAVAESITHKQEESNAPAEYGVDVVSIVYDGANWTNLRRACSLLSSDSHSHHFDIPFLDLCCMV